MNKKSWIPDYVVPAWARRSRYYLMEFVASLSGLIVTAFLLDDALFAIARYLSDATATTSRYDQMNIWTIAVIIVALPLTLLLYKRSRFEELDRPAVASTKLRRFFFYGFMLTMLVAASAFMVVAIHSAIMVALGANDFAMFLERGLPAALAAFLHALIFRSFMRVSTPIRIKEFALLFSIVGMVILAALAAMSSIQARASLFDHRTSQDLQKISDKIDANYLQDGKLPSQLSDIELEGALQRNVQNRGYAYQKKNDYSYQLCAHFKAESSGGNEQEVMAEKMAYPGSTDFYQHGKGRHCFTVNGGFRALPYGGSGSAEGGQAPSIDSLLDAGSSL